MNFGFLRSARIFVEANGPKTVGPIVCLLLTACASGNGRLSPKLLESLQTEQQANHVFIGCGCGNGLEYIDTTSGNSIRTVSLSPQTRSSARSLDIRAGNGVQYSSDGKWIASCDEKSNCTVSEKSDPNRRISVPRKDILTPLDWSPDEKLIFFVRTAPRWRLPIRCSFEDEWDVNVLEIPTGLHGVLTTVCGGFPYGSLRWYEVHQQ